MYIGNKKADMSEIRMLAHLGVLIKGKVIAVVKSKNDEEPTWALKIRLGNKTYNAWILCDEEGNGPGHLEIKKAR